MNNMSPLPPLRFFGVAVSLLISSNWLMGSQGSGSATAGEGVSATAEEDELCGARSGVQSWVRDESCISFSRLLKRIDLRRAPFWAVLNNAFSNHSAFLSTLTKDTAPTVVSIYFTSRP